MWRSKKRFEDKDPQFEKEVLEVEEETIKMTEKR